MAREPKMIYCRKCGTQFNKKCNRCPQCGKRSKKPLIFRGWFIFLLLIFVGFVFLMTDSPKESKPTQNSSHISSSSAGNKFTPETKPASNTTESTDTTPMESGPISTEKATSQDQPLINGMRPDFVEAMDAYEEFYMEYCDFLEEYNKNPSNLTLLAKYTELMTKATEMDQAFDKWENNDLNNEELKYYLDVHNRVMQRLLDVME